MKFIFCLLITFYVPAVFGAPLFSLAGETDFNFGWKFSLEADDKAASSSLNDQNWTNVRLPHDWSVALPFDSTKEGATGYLGGGIGWYRKHFKHSANQNQSTYILFDGVYNNSTVYINGKKVGFHPYGYSPFYYDITALLNKSGDNFIAVKVDHSRYADSRWYAGSGIYRKVQLIVKDKLSIPIWGIFVTTPAVSYKQASVQLKVNVVNNYNHAVDIVLKTAIHDEQCKKVDDKTDHLLLDRGDMNRAYGSH